MAIRLSRTFVLRKLHQLSGIVPLGAFLLEHFYTNSKAIAGAASFNKAVEDLQAIPYILLVEITFIFIPLIYHAVYGLVITAEARPNNLALHADAFAVNDAHDSKPLCVSFVKVFLDNCFHLFWRNGVQIEDVGDFDHNRLGKWIVVF